MAKNTQSKAADQGVKRTRIGSAAELQGLVEAPIVCAFDLDGKALEVELKRLSPGVQDTIRAIGREAQPPWSAERKDYDYLSPKFLAARERGKLLARAVALYAGCPIIAAAKPGLVNKEEMFNHVQGMFSEIILELFYQTLTGEGVSLEERVNFTSTAGSAPS